MPAKKKILMVNGLHYNCRYIPMWPFGLCDFLYQRGVKSKIFNASVYNKNDYLVNLKRTIRSYKPDYVGLIIHWKELIENIIFLSNEIKKTIPNILLVAGGVTASFLSEELLKRFKSIDFVIKGDPELPF